MTDVVIANVDKLPKVEKGELVLLRLPAGSSMDGCLKAREEVAALFPGRLVVALLGDIDIAAADPHMRVTLNHCSECDKAASSDAWDRAWWAERSRRMADATTILGIEPSSKYGLDGKMVCPHCAFVHSDDDCSAVAERDGYAFEIPGAS